VIGRRLNVPVVSKTPEEAKDHFGWFALFAGMDVAASSERTRALLGWEPKQPGLIPDIDRASYFKLERTAYAVLRSASLWPEARPVGFVDGA